MSTVSTEQDQNAFDSPSCPDCGGGMEVAGEAPTRYFTCRSCNLLFLA